MGALPGSVYLTFDCTPREAIDGLPELRDQHGLGPETVAQFADDIAKISSTSRGYTIGIDGAVLVWLDRADLGCLIHELTHAVFHVFNYASVPTSYKNQETFAYHLEHLVGQININPGINTISKDPQRGSKSTRGRK